MKPPRPLLPALVVMLLALPLAAQEPGDSESESAAKPGAGSSGPTPLAIRQERVKRLMEDLERKFTSLAQSLEKTEPEQAARLKKALVRSKELQLDKRMVEIAKMLNESQLQTAGDEQKKIVADLQILIAILLEEGADDDVKEEIRRLEQFRKRIAKLLEEERKQLRETDKVANKDKTLADLDRQIKQLEGLIKREEGVIRETIKKRAEAVERLGDIADEQRDVRKGTEALAKELGGGRGGDGDASDGEGGDGGKPGSKDGSGGGAKSGGEGAKDGSGGGAKSGSEGGAEGGGSEGGSESGSDSGEPGQKSLQRATGHQQSAEKNLMDRKGKAAERDEQKALVEMQKALEELKRERARIASLPPEAFDKMAEQQDQTAKETGRVAEDMKKSGGGGGGSGGGGGGDGSGGEGTPGQEEVQKAQKSMQQASGGLKKKDPGDAARNQEDAVNELKKALEEIEERLKQLRDEEQLDLLARLEARFMEMLTRQKVVSADTIELDERKQGGGGQLARADRLRIRKFAEEERALAEMADQALDILIEDGTSVVFPRVVEHLRNDLVGVSKLLDDARTDDYTQSVQKEIERTLEELIEALQQAQKEIKGGGGGGGGGGIPPLLPDAAELKLLRSAQLRVNRRTTAFDTARKEGPLDRLMRNEIRNITSLQQEVATMTREIVERY